MSTPTTTPTRSGPAEPPSAQQLESLIELTVAAATAYDRPDLAELVGRSAARHDDRDLSVLVVGEFKQGKSTLVNAVLNAEVCAIADDVATVVPTIVKHGTEPSAHVVYHAPVDAGDDATERREQVTVEQARSLGSEAGNPGNRAGVRAIELAIPRRILETGLQLVDTPGVGGLDSTHGAATMSALSLAELVLFVSDATQPLTAPEMEFLRVATERSPNVVLVITKTDIHPSWREVVDIDRRYLADAGLDIEVVPVSSTLRQLAVQQNSTDLNAESGYGRLVPLLREAAQGEAARLAARSVVHDLVAVVDQLTAGFEHERAVLEDPDALSSLVAELDAARERAERLRGQSAKWFQTLNDGVQDLTADLDHDLRLRVRRVLDEVDEALGDHDPLDVWDEFEHWLHTRAAYEISAHHHELARRSDELARRVGEHFAEDEVSLGVQLSLPTPSVDTRSLSEDLTIEAPKRGDAALAAMRGSYGGLLMFGMMGQMIGMALINPLTVIVGVGLGRKAFKEDRARKLAQRQQQAKIVTRKYLDEVNVQATKVSRDTVRQVHRSLRDEFSARADSLQTTIRESLQQAERSTKQATAERAARAQDVAAELERLRALRTRLVDAMQRLEPAS